MGDTGAVGGSSPKDNNCLASRGALTNHADRLESTAIFSGCQLLRWEGCRAGAQNLEGQGSGSPDP